MVPCANSSPLPKSACLRFSRFCSTHRLVLITDKPPIQHQSRGHANGYECHGRTFLLSRCSTSCVQRSIHVCSTKHHSTRRTAASTPQTLLVASICGPAGCHQLVILRHRRLLFGRRAFTVAGPAAWNSLPEYLRVRHVPLTVFAWT